MSGMADEMARRIAEDRGSGLPSDAGAVPGNEGGAPPPAAAPPAGESNADTAGAGGTPESIPYARFKEVNDRYSALRGYEELEQYGYDADSLRRLAAFEASYLQDPVGTWRTMADNLDLPQEVRDAIVSHLEGDAGSGNGRAEGEPPAGGTPPAPELSPEMKERFDYLDQLREREQDAAREAQLQAVVEAWDRMDKTDDLPAAPRRLQLQAIASTAQGGGQWRTYDELAQAARESVLEYREAVLGSAVRTGRGGSPPAALPGSAPASAGPVKFGSIREASKAAEAAIARGELPAIQP